MSMTLVLKSSILGEHSQSNQLIDAAIEGLKDSVVRDLAANPLPALDAAAMTAINNRDAPAQSSSELVRVELATKR